jgi:hypothetical protein
VEHGAIQWKGAMLIYMVHSRWTAPTHTPRTYILGHGPSHWLSSCSKLPLRDLDIRLHPPLASFILKMATEMYTDMSVQLESQSYTLVLHVALFSCEVSFIMREACKL